MNYLQCQKHVECFINNILQEQEGKKYNKYAYALGALQEQATLWLTELEDTKAKLATLQKNDKLRNS